LPEYIKFCFFYTDCPFLCINILADTDISFSRIWDKVKNKSQESMRYDYESMEMLVPFVKESVGESNLPDRTLTMEKTDGEIAEDNLDWEKETDMDVALDFADSF